MRIKPSIPPALSFRLSTPLREANPDMKAQLFFVPNRIDARIGTSEENKMWKQTDLIFKKLGNVTPRIASRATLKRINTLRALRHPA